MSKSKSQNADASSQSNRPGWFVRPHPTDSSQPMYGSFELNSVQSLFYLYPEGQVEVYKRLKNGEPGAKPIARGSVHRNRSRNPNAPSAVGHISTGKGTRFGIVLWYEADANSTPPRPYWVLRYELERPAPVGQVVTPDMLPA